MESRVGAGEVHELEDAEAWGRFGEAEAADALLVDDHHLAGSQLAHEGGPDDVECRRLRGEDPSAVLEGAEAEGAEPVRVADAHEGALVHDDERERTLDPGEDACERLVELELRAELVRLPGEQLDEHFGVGDVRETRLGGEVDGVGEVAVVAEGEGAVADLAEHRLGIGPLGGAGRGVAGVADRHVPFEAREHLLVEYLWDEAELLEDRCGLAVRRADACALLTAVLEGEEPEVGEEACLSPRGPGPEDATSLPGAPIGVDHVGEGSAHPGGVRRSDRRARFAFARSVVVPGRYPPDPMATVLLIADDDWVRNDVEAALSGPRRSIVTEADPRAAVSRAAEVAPEAIVIDLQVGSMGGMAVVRACKDAIAANQLAEAPLVLLLDRAADRFLADRSGADAWVTKPFTAQELRAVIPAGSSV